MKNLILVESPTKARTLTKFLGSDYQIEATMGHVRDLPEKTIGLDPEHDFKPEYVVSAKRKAMADKLKKLSREATNLILATDPDREGEAIAWHVAALVAPKLKIKNPSFVPPRRDYGRARQKSKISRIVFHEITEKAVKEALEHPKEIDMNLVDAQQARRILDRLVGYKLSPLLWKKVRRGLSAGRVQSVALRLIVERDREIEAFKPMEYWEIEAELKKKQITSGTQEENSFKAKFLGKIPGKNNDNQEVQNQSNAETLNENLESQNTDEKTQKIEINSKELTDQILQKLEGREWKVLEVSEREIKKTPFPPFMTSTMQQAAGNKFGWSAKRTMQVAQSLYEGGHITYHRTDSLNLNMEALDKARKFIKSNYGEGYIPDKPRFYKTKSKVAQEAHEAIRPTIIENIEYVKNNILGEIGREASKLYELIWKRFLASQMSDAVYFQSSCDIGVYNYIFRATGQKLKFDGWKKLFINTNNPSLGNLELDGNNDVEGYLPNLTKDEILTLLNLLPSQHFTEPPFKYTESSLIKALEERSIGRPSTYAPIISTILERRYVEKLEKKFSATSLGFAVCDFLTVNFPEIMDYSFTAKMEDELDGIANGELKWVPIIKEFYDPFIKHLGIVEITAERVKVEAPETEEKCDLCGANLVIRIGRFGKFLACSRFPQCKFTKPLLFNTGLTCPKCSGNVILRRTKRGKQFYGCSNYPKCDFASWTKPQIETKEQNAKTKEQIKDV